MSRPAFHRFRPASIVGHLILIALGLLCLFPVYWMFATSLRPVNDIFGRGLVPLHVTLANYRAVFAQTPIARMLFNTFAMAALVAVCQTVTSLLAAYAFARWRFPGDRFLLLAFIGTWLIPFQVTMIPNYVLIAHLGWLNTIQGLVVPQAAAAFAILMLVQYMKGFPVALLDAARLDGASSWGTLWRVVLPNLRAPLAALGILLFISTWNEYFWPLLVTNKAEHAVIQVGLQMFLTSEGNQWGQLMAAASLASIPIFVIYALLQRQVIDAFVRSGLK